MENRSLGTCIWKGVKWMPRLIYWLCPEGIAKSFVFGVALSILLWPIWLGSIVIVTLINYFAG